MPQQTILVARRIYYMEKFAGLRVWQKAHQLVLFVYKITRTFPTEEKFNLVSQMRRSAISVTANIVEGTKRRTIRDRSNFHVIANTSLEELKYYFLLANDLGYIPTNVKQEAVTRSQEIGRMLHWLNQSL